MQLKTPEYFEKMTAGWISDGSSGDFAVECRSMPPSQHNPACDMLTQKSPCEEEEEKKETKTFNLFFEDLNWITKQQ